MAEPEQLSNQGLNFPNGPGPISAPPQLSGSNQGRLPDLPSGLPPAVAAPQALQQGQGGLRLPEVKPTLLPFEVEGRDIVLVDDVLYTGRTTRAALDALMDWGRPRRIWLAVLIDRGHRFMPVSPNFVGMDVATTMHQHISIEIDEAQEQIEAFLV